LNVDLGARATPGLSAFNAEGAGFSGERDLLAGRVPFGGFHVLTLLVGAGKESVRAFLDAAPQGSRDRQAASMRMDQCTVGARFTSLSGAPSAQRFLDGDIAEVLLFARVLSEAELAQTTSYLREKHAGLFTAVEPLATGKPLVPVKDPPMVQMLVPGFAVREMHLQLTNIDSLRYRHDGVLVAGAYNGKIWLLTDTNGDGLEDKADLYWESEDLKNVIGMALTPAGDPRGDGVFVATAGRILFIPDKNRDGRGDEQIVVASGWEKQQAPGGGGSVDSVGVTLAPDGSIYFGLGTSAYNNAYLLDKDGRSHYQLESERGTVLRIAPDFSKREVVCTGIRYPIGMAFNRQGDLFATEQEGATWLPNGNPFDELLHIQPQRHYGFPPRHPRHLPGVIDEPSVFDYAPQHQSTCGIVFNEAAAERLVFGPSWWTGDALIAGEARGKLWRTQLAKTAAGYVAQTQLFACLGMLTVDLALSPSGELIVACHSGGPDWGTGPSGAGRLFKIAHLAGNTPQPVLSWNSAPGEWRVEFDRELDPAQLRNFAKGVEITQGRHVAAGDPFETIRPGYQAVKDQLATPRFDVPVLGAALAADRRTIILTTAPQTAAYNYAITMPRVGESGKMEGALPQYPQVDLAATLGGVTAEWTATNGGEKWSGWLPHADLDVAREFTRGSAEHARLWELAETPGTLVLRGQLNLWEMLHPAIQPGAKLDYERPMEKVRIEAASNHAFAFERADSLPKASIRRGERKLIEVESREGEWLPFGITLETGGVEPAALSLTWSTAEDPRARAFPTRRFLLPWSKAKVDPLQTTAADRNLPELVGGNWLRGRGLYFGKAQCHTCHAIRGEGGRMGPELSNLIHRDLASVERDIREPSAALNPNHVGYQVTLRDGSELVGVVVSEDRETLRLGDATGAMKSLERSAVRALKPLPVSLMPPGLLDLLTPGERRDLLTYLLTPGLEPAAIEASNPPPARSRAELEAVLGKKTDAQTAPNPKPLRILLCFAKKDHGPGEHDYPLWADRWSRLLGLAENVQVAKHGGWPTAEQFAGSDVIVFYSNNSGWNSTRKPELDDFIQRGGGAVFIHWAIEGGDDAPALAECIGFASNSKTTKYRHGEMMLSFPQSNHPITRGFQSTRFIDESYWQLVGNGHSWDILGEQVEDGAPRPQLWAGQRGAGRVLASIPGHFTWTFDDPLFRVLVLRGICWAAKEPVDRLNELVTIGARLE
jgi:putative heme-binding domain-containing protein